MNVNVEWIEPNPRNPRKNFDPGALQELAESIKSVGIVQPLVVVMDEERTKNDNSRMYFRLIAGERRWRAAQIAGLKEVPVIIKKFTAAQEAEVMIIENLQRQDLDPIDEARGMQAMLTEYGYTQERLAEKLGCSQGHIANRIRMLELPDTVLEKISQEIITPAHAKHLIKLKDLPEALNNVLEVIVDERHTEKDTADYIDEYINESFKRLFVSEYESWKNPKFDLTGCRGCDKTIKAHYLGELRKFCTDEDCWDEHQEREEKERTEKQIASRTEVIDLNRCGYSNWKMFNQYSTGPAFDYKACEGCESKRKGKFNHSEEIMDICINPECFEKKRAAATREKNKSLKEAYKKEVELVKKTFEKRAQAKFKGLNLPFYAFDKTDLIFIASNILWHVKKNYHHVVERPSVGQYMKERFGIDSIQDTYANFGYENFNKTRKVLEKLTAEQLLQIIMEWPVLARGTDEHLTKWYFNECTKK